MRGTQDIGVATLSLSLSGLLCLLYPRFDPFWSSYALRLTVPFASQVELGKTAEATKLGIYTDDSVKQDAGVSKSKPWLALARACVCVRVRVRAWMRAAGGIC